MGAIIPAAVGVDIGCGMMSVRTSLRAADLPDNLCAIPSDIEAAVPHGFSSSHRNHSKGGWSFQGIRGSGGMGAALRRTQP